MASAAATVGNALALLEHLDSAKLTERRGASHLLRRRSGAG